MYSKTFLTMCPVCKSVSAILRIYLHLEVTCTKCSSRFRAEENFVEIEDVEERELHCKELQEVTTKSADREDCHDFDRPGSTGREHYSDKPLEWRLVSSKGLQEETSDVGADVEACTDSVRPPSFETREHHEEMQVGVAAEVSSRELGWPQESRVAQAGPKLKKRKRNLSSETWGIALRKPSRQKRKVKSYSPSRESGLRKQGKLKLKKSSKVRKCDSTAAKKYQKKGVQVENRESRRSQRSVFSDGDVSKDKSTTEGTAGKPSKLVSEGYSEEFKNFMAAEIKRQVVEGLGEASKKLITEIQIVEVEEILVKTQTSEQQFVAQVKLTATLSFPITLRASEGSPARSLEVQKSRDNTEEECKGREAPEDKPKDMEELKPKDMEELEPQDMEELEPQDMKEFELKDMEELGPKDMEEPEPKDMEAHKDMEEPEPKDMEEPQPTGLMEFDKPSDGEPLFEDGCEVDVPDSEYYDFEFNRSEDKFAPHQVWASYDASFMPRDYVQIKKVVSTKPFKVHIAVLEPAWLAESGNPLSCGEFSADYRVKVLDEINGFSHLMKWEYGQNGMIQIYPGEKEVWALYKAWKEIDQEKRIKHGYDIVQVVAMEEDLTASVVPLVNYKGSSTVFRKKERELFQIHKKDFDRFSHQIPIYEIIGYAGVEGCVELDPAAIPSQ